MAQRNEALLGDSLGFAGAIGDLRLSLEVTVITVLAQRILRLIKTRDPLSDNVHLTKIGIIQCTLAGLAAGSLARLAGGGPASHKSKDA